MDISNPIEPEFLGLLDLLPDFYDNFDVKGDYLYRFEFYSGLSVYQYDISDINSPIEVYRANLGDYRRTSSITTCIQGITLMSSCRDYFTLLDISDPDRLRRMATIQLQGIISDYVVVGDYIYTAESTRFAIYNAADYLDVSDNRRYVEDFSISFTASPNPSNGSMALRFNLQQSGLVNLVVRDVTGREVMTPLDNAFTTAGSHRIELKETSLSSGLYFATLQTNNTQQTIKLVMLE